MRAARASNMSMVHSRFAGMAWPLALITLCLAGCGPKKPEGVGEPATPPSATAAKPTEQPEPGKAPEEKPDAANRPKENPLKPDPVTSARMAAANAKLLTIPKPGTANWSPAAMSAAELGQKADNAIKTLPPTYLESFVRYEFPEIGELSGKLETRFQDSKRFIVEYYTPETKATTNRIVADGKRMAERYNSLWRPMSYPTGHSSQVLSDAETAAWTSGFIKRVFAPYIDGRDAWGPLLKAWSQGKAGYSLAVEQKTQRTGGQTKTMVRAVASTSKGRPTEVEVTFDAAEYLPLSIRVTESLPDGRKNRILWTAQWFAGGKHDLTAFVVPNPLPTG